MNSLIHVFLRVLYLFIQILLDGLFLQKLEVQIVMILSSDGS